jgi:hypothetical protein
MISKPSSGGHFYLAKSGHFYLATILLGRIIIIMSNQRLG